MNAARPRLARGAALFLLLAACSQRTPIEVGSRAPAGRLVTATASDPRTFNPVLVTDQTSSQALADVFEPLVRTNPLTTEPEPVLADRWEWSGDGRACTFHLRDGVRWHDGRPFTSDDVVFTFEAIFDERVANSARFALTVDGQPIVVTAPDAATVRFSMPRPFAPFLAAVEVPILPRHVLGGSLADGSFSRRWGIDAKPAELVGTGPYRMKSYVPAQWIEYVRNPDYWRRDADGRRLPLVEGKTILVVPEQNAMSLRFLSGQTSWYNPRPEEIADLRERADQLGIRVEETGADPGNLFVAFNRNPRHYGGDATGKGVTDPRWRWFTDKRFVAALSHAVDKQGMIETIFYGFGAPAVAYVAEANRLYHDPDIQDPVYDLALAQQMLDEAGYRDRDGDGWREDRDGNRIQFSLATNAGNFLRERMCSILREDWTSIGLKIDFRPQSFQSLVERLGTTFDWDAILIGFTGSIEPNNGANFLRSSGNLHLWNPRQETPATPWEAEIDRLLDQGSAELDPAKRAVFYRRIQQILHEEMPFLETVRQKIAVAYSRRLVDFRPTVWGLAEPERIALR